MAAQLAGAFERAKLFEAQREIADTLQSTLLTLPEKISGLRIGHLYRSASAGAAEVGGDFYDLIELEHGKIGIVIGDISGKGLAAATSTSLVRNSLRAYAFEGHDPALVISKTSGVLFGHHPTAKFATVFFGTLDTGTGRLVYCNAGHPPPLVRKPGGVRAELLPTGPAIGVFPDLRYGFGEELLTPDDIFIGYTDGLIEARRTGELFGEARLTQAVASFRPASAESLPELLFERLVDYGGDIFADDIAILTLSLAPHS
jgi:phosphoserine phosphatase RsbU/P